MDPDMELIEAPLGAFPGNPLRGALATDTGRERERNEDSVGAFVPGADGPGAVEAAVIVADGVGGHEGGARASRFVVDAARDTLADQPGAIRDLPAWLSRLLTSIHRELLDEARDTNSPASLGTTATIAAFQTRTLILAHVGDSRAYRLRNDRLEQLTDDDSWVAEQQRRGVLAEDDPEAMSRRNVLTQCLGIGKSLKVQLRQEGISVGDRYLLCSDGLHGVVPDDVIRDVLASERGPEAAARRLVALANDGGGPDNISAAVIDIGEVPRYGSDAPAPDRVVFEGPAPDPALVVASAAEPTFPSPHTSTGRARRRASTTITALGVGLLALGAGSWISLAGSSPAGAEGAAATPDPDTAEPLPPAREPRIPVTPPTLDPAPDTVVVPEGDTTESVDTLPSPDSSLTADTLIPTPGVPHE